LQREGHDVVGAFIKIWNPDFLECTWKQDRIDAMRVCVSLGIPFREIDLSQEYMRGVVDDMIATYRAGRTPNPDVLCNRHIKFGAFKKWAIENGAEMVATGHYAQTDGTRLMRGIDSSKDQSYFLYRLTREDLAVTRFPIGHLPKSEVRALAKKFDLPVSQKPDSQGLCFVGDVSIPEFLSRYITLSKGPVVDMNGKVIGEHDGAASYTIGQRHGFRAQGIHYVVGIDIPNNTITVSENKSDALSASATLADVHWIGEAPASGTELSAQSRYHSTVARASLSHDGSTWQASFAQPELLSPGQSVVFYDGDVCLGGGVVENVA
jgi:tRNA-specific 2-thiouridylase